MKKHKIWTRKKCKEEALKYNTPWEWGRNSNSSYSTSLKAGWHSYCTAHMYKKRMKWDEKELIEIIHKCSTLQKLRNKYPTAYSAITRYKFTNKDIKDAFDKLSKEIPSTSKFTPKFMRQEAKKYNRRKDFCKKSGGCHSAAKKYDKTHPGFFESICKHMLFLNGLNI